MKKIASIVVTILVASLGWYLLSPLFLNTVVDEDLDVETLTAEDVDAMPEQEQQPQQPRTIATGTFVGADSFHKGSGSATIYELPDGSRVVRFENFSVTNGPALAVYLTQQNGEKIRLDALKGNMGNQNYSIAPDIQLSLVTGVLIYCEPFRVMFATATFQ